MPEHKDDPRQVLALLNSLGFVGITGEQLKAFMKDLKMYRKIKERERQHWKEQMKSKILDKQREEFAKLINEVQGQEVTADQRQKDRVDPLVKIKIQCVSDSSEDDECQEEVDDTTRGGTTQATQKELPTRPVNLNRSRSQPKIERRAKISRECRSATLPRVESAPNLTKFVPKSPRPKSTSSEPTQQPESSRNPSRCSSRSQPKTFIRPWKLHPEVQRSQQALKSDPVALYQSYQKQWKKISFLGENRHADIRWAVREKMLGGDPTPRPILKQCSSTSVKRR